MLWVYRGESKEIQNISGAVFETPIGEEEDSHLGDFIQDDNVPVPAEAAAFTLLKEQLVEVLGTYRKGARVLRLRFDWMMEGQGHERLVRSLMLLGNESVKLKLRH